MKPAPALNPKPKTPADWHERGRILSDRHRPQRPELECMLIVQGERLRAGKFSFRCLLSGPQHENVLAEPELRREMLKAIAEALK